MVTSGRRYREALPQLGEDPFLTDAGMETWLVFDRGIDLPEFAAFHLLRDDSGTQELRAYFEPYLALAARYGTGSSSRRRPGGPARAGPS